MPTNPSFAPIDIFTRASQVTPTIAAALGVNPRRNPPTGDQHPADDDPLHLDDLELEDAMAPDITRHLFLEFDGTAYLLSPGSGPGIPEGTFNEWIGLRRNAITGETELERSGLDADATSNDVLAWILGTQGPSGDAEHDPFQQGMRDWLGLGTTGHFYLPQRTTGPIRSEENEDPDRTEHAPQDHSLGGEHLAPAAEGDRHPRTDPIRQREINALHREMQALYRERQAIEREMEVLQREMQALEHGGGASLRLTLSSATQALRRATRTTPVAPSTPWPWGGRPRS